MPTPIHKNRGMSGLNPPILATSTGRERRYPKRSVINGAKNTLFSILLVTISIIICTMAYAEIKTYRNWASTQTIDKPARGTPASKAYRTDLVSSFSLMLFIRKKKVRKNSKRFKES